MTPKYPHVRVQLGGLEGNAFAIIGRVTRAMRGAGIKKPELDAFMNEACAGNFVTC